MANKVIRENLELAIGTADIIGRNPRIGRESEAYKFAYELAASQLKPDLKAIDWIKISQLDFQDDLNIDINFPETRTLTIDDGDLEIVLESYKEQLPKAKRIQFSYLTRLCVLNARKTLREWQYTDTTGNESATVEVKNIDGVALIGKLAGLLEDDSEEAQRKIMAIKTILEED